MARSGISDSTNKPVAKLLSYLGKLSDRLNLPTSFPNWLIVGVMWIVPVVGIFWVVPCLRMSHVMHVFVYGTLKRNQCRSHHLQNQKFLGLARTSADYRMHNVGEYPGLVDASTGASL